MLFPLTKFISLLVLEGLKWLRVWKRNSNQINKLLGSNRSSVKWNFNRQLKHTSHITPHKITLSEITRAGERFIQYSLQIKLVMLVQVKTCPIFMRKQASQQGENSDPLSFIKRGIL